MHYIAIAIVALIAIFIMFILPGFWIADKFDHCHSVTKEICHKAVLIDAFIFWIGLAIIPIGLSVISKRKRLEAERRVIASHGGREFRIKDRIAYNKNTLPSVRGYGLPYMAIQGDDCGHSSEIRIEPGKTGTVIGGVGSNEHVLVLWDAQEWTEYNGRRKIRLLSFKDFTHVEYLDITSTT